MTAPRLAHISLPPRSFYLFAKFLEDSDALVSLTINALPYKQDDYGMTEGVVLLLTLQILVMYVDVRNPGQSELMAHLDFLIKGGNLKEIQLKSGRADDMTDAKVWEDAVQTWAAQGTKVWFNGD